MRNALFNEGEHITFHINNIGHIAIGCKKGTLFPLCFGVPCLSKRDLLDRKRIFCVCNNIYFLRNEKLFHVIHLGMDLVI